MSSFIISLYVFGLQRQGRCDTFATEFDLEAEEYVPLPKGDVHKKKEIIQDVTLHDLDVANARPQVCAQKHHAFQVDLHDTNNMSVLCFLGRPGHTFYDGSTDETQKDGNHR